MNMKENYGISFKIMNQAFGQNQETWPYISFLPSYQLLGLPGKILSGPWLSNLSKAPVEMSIYFKGNICICESDTHSILKYIGKLKIIHTYCQQVFTSKYYS